MGTATVRGGFDTWAGSAAPTTERYGTRFLNLDAGSQEAFIYFKAPAPRGATVTSATLRLYAVNASSGSRTISAARVASSWSARQLNWNNRPGTTGTAATKAIGTLADLQAIDIDVTSHVQAFVNGAPNYGWKITTTGTTTHQVHGLFSVAGKPTLTVVWSDAPKVPTTLNPSGGVVGTSKPTLQFDYTDVSGSTQLGGVQVQIDPSANGSTPAFDSGQVSTTYPQLNLANTSYAGLADNATTQWRVRVQDRAGLWSGWSKWATFTYKSKPTVTITNPDSGEVLWDTTPDITWTLSASQSAWQVRITSGYDRSRVYYDSGKRTGTATAHTLPKGVLYDDRTYSVNVRAWDTNTSREATPGVPIFSEAWQNFKVDDDLATAPVDSLTATQRGATPWVDLQWSRSLTPTTWTIYRDGKVIEQLLTPAETLVSGTTYKWTDYGADPQRVHTYNVRSVMEGKQSQAGPTASVTTKPQGIWLADIDRGIYVTLAGDDAGDWTMVDDAAVYTPIGSTEIVRIVSGMRGLEGSLSGYLVAGFGRTFASLEADLWSIKEQPATKVRLVVGDVNIPALIGNITVAPTPSTRNGDIVKNVSFDFWQVGELPWANI